MKNIDIETMRHVNKIQADEIQSLRQQVIENRTRYLKAECEREIYHLKHRNLLREFRAFKDLIRHLGSAETNIEWQDHGAAQG